MLTDAVSHPSLAHHASLASAPRRCAIASSAATPRGTQPPPEPRLINASDRSAARAVPLPLHRAGQHGRAHRRHRGAPRAIPNIIYLGYAVGGVFKSENNGTTFEPVFDTYTTASIGDIAIHPTNPNIVYVGTGEANNRQTSSFGDGIYKTTDGGKTFTHIGLRETQTIARIVIDPRNPDTVYVAAPGHLFGPNPERGVYKTTDGGRTWNKVKFIDEDTGLHRHRDRSGRTRNILYAASYQRRRMRLLLQRRRPGQRAVEDAPTPARRGRS